MSWALIAHTISPDAAGSTTPAIDTTGADLIVINGVNFTGLGGLQIPTDFYGNIYIPVATYSDGANIESGLLYASFPTVGAGHTFTPGNIDNDIYVGAFSGSVASPLDQFAGNGNASTPNSITASISPAGTDFLTVTGLGNAGTGQSVLGGFNVTDMRDFGAGGWVAGGMAYLVNATIATWTWSGYALNEQTISIASFLPGAGFVPAWAVINNQVNGGYAS